METDSHVGLGTATEVASTIGKVVHSSIRSGKSSVAPVTYCHLWTGKEFGTHPVHVHTYSIKMLIPSQHYLVPPVPRAHRRLGPYT